jgi:hypothetical protein
MSEWHTWHDVRAELDDALGSADEQGNGATNYAARWQYGLTPLPHRRL